MHVDGTARVQTVAAETNPRYHALLVEFGRLTGVPVLLNTSFNEQEPIVTTPAEAIACFLRTDMDVLVLGNCHVVRAALTLPRSLAPATVMHSAHNSTRTPRTTIGLRTLGADGATS